MSAYSENPMGTEGFSFVEFASADPAILRELLGCLGCPVIGRHRHRDTTLHAQGEIRFLVDGERTGFTAAFATRHGPSACAMGFRVRDARAALMRARALGARVIAEEDRVLSHPAIEGIGGAHLYLVEDGDGLDAFAADFDIEPDAGERLARLDAGLGAIDHLTHNVRYGHMDRWYAYYTRLFGFREIRHFDIRGRHTGLRSRALASPEGKIRIPLNESPDEKSQINEYLERYAGEGIQHIALASRDIYATVDRLRAAGIAFQHTPDTYYERVDERLPGHGEPLEELRRRRILVDGGAREGGGLLLQIFTVDLVGPIFFEIIERKGNEGFGEGNFRALFESIEEDQIRRGYLEAGRTG